MFLYQIYFENNERLDDDELESITNEINLINFNTQSVNLFIDEIKEIYQSFGYNNVSINYSIINYNESNTVDLYFDINEGTLTKINKIITNIHLSNVINHATNLPPGTL